MMSGIAYAHWFLGNFEESLRWARQSVLTNPKFTTGHRTLIFTLVSTGRLEEARSAARELLRLDPTASVTRFRASSPFQKLELLEKGFAGLRAAGIPE
jgi:adenylate cyclase